MVDKKQISKLYSAAKLSETEQSVLEYLLNNIDTLDDIGGFGSLCDKGLA